MTQKRMLVADPDARAWDEFRQALGDTWIVEGVSSSDAALAEARRGSFDVVAANFDLPGSGGVELLNQLRAESPRTLRFIAAQPALQDKVMGSMAGEHQFLAVPFDRATLKASIERPLEVVDYGMSDNVRELVGRIRTFPTIPSIYLEVVNALKDPAATTAEIGAIIAKDLSMTTKLVQVINSAYFGLPRTITDPAEAVGLLGFEQVKSLIMTVKLLSQYDKVRPVYFSIDSIWRHSTHVARTARVMALLETNDIDCSSTAYTAGLMHDLGKVILAANFDPEYHRAHIEARKQQMPLWAAEKAIFGATHGEIGAYLLSVWGLSAEVVKVAALHHHPFRAADKTFTALTAVHVANVLENEACPEANGLPAPQFDLTYLEKMDMVDRIDMWRLARRERDAGKLSTKSSVKHSEPAPSVAMPQEKPDASSRRRFPSLPGGLWRWVGIGMCIGVALVWLIEMEISQMVRVVTTPPTETAKIAAVVPAKVAEPAAPKSQAVSTPAIPAPALPAPDPFKLQAIFYDVDHPSAMINGQLAVINQQVGGCRVLEISHSSVTVEYQNQRKVLTLK